MSAPGLTLAETLISAAILAIVSAAAALPFAAARQQGDEAERLEMAILLTQSLLDEIAGHPFEDPATPGVVSLGPDSGEPGRKQFDNIDDYHGYSEATTGVVDIDGNLEPGPQLAGLHRTVTVTMLALLGQKSGDTNSLARIDVTMHDGKGALLTLKRVVAREY